MEKFEHEYKADQIQVLEGLEAVRKMTMRECIWQNSLKRFW